MVEQENGADQAPHACTACRRQKRKCDKKLPQCSLCLRMTRDCSYYDPVTPSSDKFTVLQDRVAELEDLLQQKHKQMEQQAVNPCYSRQFFNPTARLAYANPFEQFPALFFLDHDIFKEARMSIPRPSPPVPEDIYQILGNLDGLKDITTRFFTTTHTWFPILSRKRFELMLADIGFEPLPDVALLFSAMHLLTDEGSNGHNSTRTNSYWSVKNYAVALEANAVMTPQLLQANLLLATYEIGHAIYPAAYLSVGKCATLGKALGLDNRKDAPQMLRRYGAWSELEELRRLWWAILLLDRYVHLSLPGHALATEDPLRNEVLPTDDAQFDQGKMAGNEPLYVGSPTSLKAGPFTRACQAAHLIGRVVALLSDLLQEVEGRFTTALQVHRTLTAFVHVLQQESSTAPEAYATPMALAYSALIALCDPFCCTESNRGAHTVEEAELQTVCIDGIMTVADDIARFALQQRPSMTSRPAAMSPLISHCLYMGTVTFAWRVYEGEKQESVDAYRLLRDALSTLNGRWAVGGEYLQSVDKAKELLYDSPLLS